jgi:hypothetical protein
VCRAVRVLCVADDDEALGELKRATVSAEWELCPGATELREALDQIDRERPHVLVAVGDWATLVTTVAEAFPGMRIVTDRDTPGASSVARSLEDVRDLVKGLPRPSGPVR